MVAGSSEQQATCKALTVQGQMILNLLSSQLSLPPSDERCRPCRLGRCGNPHMCRVAQILRCRLRRMEVMERAPLAMRPGLAALVGRAFGHSQRRTCLLLLDLVGTHT